MIEAIKKFASQTLKLQNLHQNFEFQTARSLNQTFESNRLVRPVEYADRLYTGLWNSTMQQETWKYHVNWFYRQDFAYFQVEILNESQWFSMNFNLINPIESQTNESHWTSTPINFNRLTKKFQTKRLF